MADVVISDLPELLGLTPDDYVIVNDGDATTTKVSFANVLASITNLTTVGFADGTEANPAVSFTNDLNVGIYRPNPDEWAVSTNGTQRLVIDPSGSVGITNSAPGDWNPGANNLVVGSPTSGDNGIVISSSPVSVGDLTFSDGTTGTDLFIGRIRYEHNDNHMSMWTNATEAMRIDQNQDVLIGTNLPIIGSRVVVAGGAVSIPTGSPGVPSLNFATDTDTGVWSEADDHVSLATGGVERVTIDDQGHFYLNGDSDTYLYHKGEDTITIANQGRDTLTLDSANNIRLGGATPTIYTNQSEIRLSVNADNSVPGSIVSVYAQGAELGRFSSQGFSLGTTSSQGLMTIGGTDPADGYPTITILRATDVTTTSDIAKDDHLSIRSGAGIRSVVNSNGIFTWSVGGGNYRAGLSGSNEMMRLTANGRLGIKTDNPIYDLTVNGNIGLVGASTSGTYLGTPVANSVAITTNSVERFRVGDGGAIGLGGANYGAAGQVLTSQGAGATPTWTSLNIGLPDISTLPLLP